MYVFVHNLDQGASLSPSDEEGSSFYMLLSLVNKETASASDRTAA